MKQNNTKESEEDKALKLEIWIKKVQQELDRMRRETKNNETK